MTNIKVNIKNLERAGLHIDEIEFCFINERDVNIILHACCKNENLFGNAEICEGVFARYRRWSQLISQKYNVDPRIIILPFLDNKESFLGDTFELTEQSYSEIVSDLDIIPIEHTFLADDIQFPPLKSSVKYALKRRRDGKIYILEQAMYLLIYLLQPFFKNPILVDIGSGSGNLANTAIYYLKPQHIYMYDYFPDLCEQLRTNFNDNSITVITGNCLEIELPQKCDILCISVNPDTIITFIHNRKKQLKEMLGLEGIAIFFVGEPKTAFTNMLLLKEKGYLGKWNWYKNVTPIIDIFKYVLKVEFRNEILVLASDNKTLMKELNKITLAEGLEIEDISRKGKK